MQKNVLMGDSFVAKVICIMILFLVDEDERDGAMDESGTAPIPTSGAGRGSSRAGGAGIGMAGIPRANRDAMHIAQTLFPSTLCTAFVEVIGLLDDHAVSLDGTGVYEVAYQVRYCKREYNIII